MASQDERDDIIYDLCQRIVAGHPRRALYDFLAKTYQYNTKSAQKLVTEAHDLFLMEMRGKKQEMAPIINARLEFLYKRAIERDTVAGDWLALGILKEYCDLYQLKDAARDTQYEIGRQAILENINKLLKETKYEIRPEI